LQFEIARWKSPACDASLTQELRQVQSKITYWEQLMKFVIAGTICTVQLSCLALSAAASVGSFTNLAAYQAAAPPELFLLTFDGNSGTTDGKAFNSFIDFDSPEASNPDLVLNSGNILRDTGSTIAPNNVGPIGGRFNGPVGGIAFDLTLVEGTAQTVRLFDAGGSLVGEATTPVGNTFFGMVSTTPFISFIIQNGMFGSGVGNDRYFLDNFRANGIPEPSAAMLLFVAIAFLASMRLNLRNRV
jgi:hypothetical protein